MTTFKQRLKAELKESINYALVETKGDPAPPNITPQSPIDGGPAEPGGGEGGEGGIWFGAFDYLGKNPNATVGEVFNETTTVVMKPITPKEQSGGLGISIPFWNVISGILSFITQKEMIPSPTIITIKEAVVQAEVNAIDLHNTFIGSPAINKHGSVDPLILDAFKDVTEG